MSHEMISINQVAALWGVSRITVYRSDLPWYRIGRSRKYRAIDALERIAQGRGRALPYRVCEPAAKRVA